MFWRIPKWLVPEEIARRLVDHAVPEIAREAITCLTGDALTPSDAPTAHAVGARVAAQCPAIPGVDRPRPSIDLYGPLELS